MSGGALGALSLSRKGCHVPTVGVVLACFGIISISSASSTSSLPCCRLCAFGTHTIPLWLSAVPAAPAVCLAAGYRASGTHTIPLGCKTDAPFHILWDILRCWVQDHPVKGADPESAGVPARLTLRAAL